ncbi:MAG: 50S ribosomal protein L15 [Alphaproteobacteria bacterium]|nr:50S ribosomal protein L15 [Pelagibacterales bacterium]MAW58845.1 50S ribosomal protein L15 [Alphaproteobacteria bacterium]OUV26421.1 MAG: 50S ribosomal protein L15 [Alphaproteobacteria bacterium TMED109]RCL83614.1 MAG: 50S ribosomal protein L15 [Alphaproteobacteria bacterium]
MRLNEISDNPYSKHNKKRVGRGIGSGKGKTSGKGHKGQKARSGVAIKGFEGGQMPLHRRLPKHGFNNIFRKQYTIIGLDDLQKAIDEGKIDNKKIINAKVLKDNGVINRIKDGIKLLGNGSINSKIEIEVTAASSSAKKAIEKVNGKISILLEIIKEESNGIKAKH